MKFNNNLYSQFDGKYESVYTFFVHISEIEFPKILEHIIYKIGYGNSYTDMDFDEVPGAIVFSFQANISEVEKKSIVTIEEFKNFIKPLKNEYIERYPLQKKQINLLFDRLSEFKINKTHEEQLQKINEFTKKSELDWTDTTLQDKLSDNVDKIKGFKNNNRNQDKITFIENLKKEHKIVQIKSWKQFYENFVVKAFEMSDENYLQYLIHNKTPFGFIGKASKAREVYQSIKHNENLDDEVKKVISVISSGNLFEKRNGTYINWLHSKTWKDFKTHHEYSILEIATFENGNNYLKTHIMEMPIFKVF